MSLISLLLIAFFLPLFPFSMLFNTLFTRLPSPAFKLLILIIWPQIGLGLAILLDAEIPYWVIGWALATSAFYGFRLVVLRELTLWTSFLATSSWSLLWIFLVNSNHAEVLYYYALGFSAPLALIVLLIHALEHRFGAAYTDLYCGLALKVPRLSGIFVITILAAIATPIFPAFFVMLAIMLASSPPTMLVLLLIWLLWSWAGARLIQGFIVGDRYELPIIADFSLATTSGYSIILLSIIAGGIYWLGALP